MSEPDRAGELTPWEDIVRRKVGALRFGTVVITIHEGRVTQIDTTERTRIESSGPRSERLASSPASSPEQFS